MKAIVPAAGLGTRFLPATKAQPKEMLLVVDRPAIQYIVEEALGAGIDEVIIVNARNKRSIEQHFAPDPVLEHELRGRGKNICADAVAHAGSLPVTFVYQEEALGLGDAIRCAADKVLDSEEPFIVSLGDVIVPKPDLIKRMVAVSKAHGDASVIAVLPVPENQVHRFGIIAGDDLGDGVWKVSTLVEKPPADRAPSNLSIFGRYLLSPKVMDILAHAEPSVGGEIQLTDSLDKLLETEEMYAVVVDSAEGFDTGTVRSWIEANVALALRDPDLGGALRDDLNEMLDNR